MSEQPLALAEAHWNAQRKGATPPARHAMEPAALSQALGQCFMLRVPDRGQARFDFTGTAIATTFGKDLKDRPFTDLFVKEHRDSARLYLACCAAGTDPVQLSLTGHTQEGGQVAVTLLLLPLGDNPPHATGIFGVINVAQHLTCPLKALSINDAR